MTLWTSRNRQSSHVSHCLHSTARSLESSALPESMQTSLQMRSERDVHQDLDLDCLLNDPGSEQECVCLHAYTRCLYRVYDMRMCVNVPASGVCSHVADDDAHTSGAESALLERAAKRRRSSSPRAQGGTPPERSVHRSPCRPQRLHCLNR